MRGTGQTPKTPTENYANPFKNSGEEEGEKKSSQQRESKNLTIIIPEKRKKKLPTSTREKLKSLTPRSSSKPKHDSEVVTLIPARPENPGGGLTKIRLPATGADLNTTSLDPQLSGGEIAEFSKITPRPLVRPQHDFLGRAKSTRPNLSNIVSPRETKKLSESLDPWTPPSDNTDVQERAREFAKVPLLRSDRSLKLDERVKASNLPRPLTQRSERPNIVMMDPRDAQRELRHEFPPLPSIVPPTLADELPSPDQDNQPVDEEIPTTASRPVEDESDKGNQDKDKAPIISTEPLVLQQDYALLDDDENKEASSSTSDEAPPKNPSDRTVEDPRERQRMPRDLTQRGPKKLTRGMAASHITLKSSKELAKVVGVLISKNPSSSANGTVRALRMIKCALDGSLPPLDPEQPETGECAARLSKVGPREKYFYLQDLVSELKPYLDQDQDRMLALDIHVGSLKKVSDDPSRTDYALRMLQIYLEREIPRATRLNIADAAYRLITDHEGERSKSARAINMIFCAAGGTVAMKLPVSGGEIADRVPLILAPGKYPEADLYAHQLIDIPDLDRYEVISALLDQLDPYLTDKQIKLVRRCLENLDKIMTTSDNPTFVESELYALRRQLQVEFSNPI